jgi:hypothetical protein
MVLDWWPLEQYHLRSVVIKVSLWGCYQAVFSLYIGSRR